MTWLLPSVVATAVLTSVLLIVYLWVWQEEKEDFLLTWSLAWAFYSGRLIAAILALQYGNHPVFVFLHLCCTALSSILLLKGLRQFVQEPMSRHWLLLTGAVTGWVVYGVITHQSFLILTVPVFMFSGIVLVATGIVALRSKKLDFSMCSVVGWAFVLRGLHEFDYPLLRPFEWFAPWGFLLGAFLSLVVAFGMIIVYFKYAGIQLKKGEEKYRNLVGNMPDVTWTTDSRGNTVFISPNIETVLGFTSAEISSQGTRLWFDRIHPDDLEEVRGALARLFENKESFDVEYRIRKNDGEWIWLHDRAMAADERDGALVADHVIRDITEQKRAEDALKQSEARYRHIFESSGVFISLYDRDGKCLLMNPTVAGYFAGTPGEFVGKSFEMLHPAAGGKYAKRIREVIESGEPREYEDLVEFPTGSRWLLSDLRPVQAPGDNVAAAQILSFDITDRRRSEDALREREAQYRTLVENLPHKVFIKDRDSVFQSCNELFSRDLGIPSSDICGKTDFSFFSSGAR